MVKWRPCRLGQAGTAAIKIPVDSLVGYGIGLGAYIPARWGAKTLDLPMVTAPLAVAALGTVISLATNDWNYLVGSGSAAFGFFFAEKVIKLLLPAE